MNKTLKLYIDTGHAHPFPNVDMQAELYSFQYDATRMGNAPTITATIMYPICLDNRWSDRVFVEFKGERYYIDSIPSSSYSNEDTRYKHEITFVSERKVLEDEYLSEITEVDGEKVAVKNEFSFFGDIQTLADRLNEYLEFVGIDYRIDVADDITTEEKEVVISNMKINDVLKYGFELFDVPYYFVGKNCTYGLFETEIDDVFEYGIDNELLSISKENRNEPIVTKITGVGSSENIPYFYPNMNPSGNHDITTTPSSLVDNIESLNYLKINSWINLRDGGSVTYYKATIDPIKDDKDDVVIENQSVSGTLTDLYKTEWKQYITAPDTGADVEYAQKEVNLLITIYPKSKSEMSLSKKMIARPDYGTVDYEQTFTINFVKGFYHTSGGDGFFNSYEEDITYNSTGDKITIQQTRTYDKINISLTCNVNFPVNEAGSVLAYFSYDTKYTTDKRNIHIQSTNNTINEYSYTDFEKVIEYPDGTRSFRDTLTTKITRELAAYSTGYFNSRWRAIFLDNQGNEIGAEWKQFEVNGDITISSEGLTGLPNAWINPTSKYAQFRNTTNQRRTYTATLNTLIDMSTADNVTAYGVKLRYEPSFGRTQHDKDWFKFDDGKQVTYLASGIKFKDTNDADDSDKIEFSETKDWIAPRPNLMPSIYRDTTGTDIWYKALNNTHKDKDGNYINFVNLYNSKKTKSLIADPKDDIKPTIVGVKNQAGDRIDMFTDIAFDTDDNNDDWKPLDDGDSTNSDNSQRGTEELIHSFFFVKLRKTDGSMGFNLFDQSIENGEMTITMTSGLCGSCDFKIMVNDEGLNTVQVDENGDLLRDEDGNVQFGTPQDIQQDTSKAEVWIALLKEMDSYGVILPDKNSDLIPTIDDTFVITNILMPEQYFLNAEKKLEYELLQDMSDSNTDKFNFSIDFSRIYLDENPDMVNNLNENSKITVKYNGNYIPLNVSSISYKMESDVSLPEIKVELAENLYQIKNVIQKSEVRIIREVKKIITDSEKPQNNVKRGGTTSSSDIDIVQTTGSSKTSVMSQKAVTDALKNVSSNSNIEISQYLGDSETSVVSQKGITREFDNVRNAIPNVVNETGQSTTNVISQKSTTDAINAVDKVLPFDGFVNDVELGQQYNPYLGGKIYFDTAKQRFVYYRDEDGIYTLLWRDYLKYAQSFVDNGAEPKSGVLFTHSTNFYKWDGSTLQLVF